MPALVVGRKMESPCARPDPGPLPRSVSNSCHELFLLRWFNPKKAGKCKSCTAGQFRRFSKLLVSGHWVSCRQCSKQDNKVIAKSLRRKNSKVEICVLVAIELEYCSEGFLRIWSTKVQEFNDWIWLLKRQRDDLLRGWYTLFAVALLWYSKKKVCAWEKLP